MNKNLINFGPNDPVRKMLQSILDKCKEQASKEELTLEEFLNKETCEFCSESCGNDWCPTKENK